MRALAATLLFAVLAACSPSGAPTSSSADYGRSNYQVDVRGAIVGLAGNREDFTTFRTSSSLDGAKAALARVKQRTSTAVDRLEASRSWAPGEVVSEQLANNQRELLSILADFEAVTLTGNDAAWRAATSRYDSWYSSTLTMLNEVVSSLKALGVSCS